MRTISLRYSQHVAKHFAQASGTTNYEEEFIGSQNKTPTSGFTRMRRQSSMQTIVQKLTIDENALNKTQNR